MSRLKLFVLLGPPGAGKSNVAKRFNPNQTIMLGHLLRNQVVTTPKDRLLSLQKVNQILLQELKKRKNEAFVILEGYPRTKEQALFLNSLQQIDILGVFNLYCSDKECIDRVLNRESCTCGCSYHPRLKPPKKEKICDNCGEPLFKRMNDTPEILAKRLHLYRVQEKEILKVFKGKCQTINIEASLKAGIDETLQSVQRILLRTITSHRVEILHNQPENQRS